MCNNLQRQSPFPWSSSRVGARFFPEKAITQVTYSLNPTLLKDIKSMLYISVYLKWLATFVRCRESFKCHNLHQLHPTVNEVSCSLPMRTILFAIIWEWVTTGAMEEEEAGYIKISPGKRLSYTYGVAAHLAAIFYKIFWFYIMLTFKNCQLIL